MNENLKTIPGLASSEKDGTSPLSGADEFDDEFSQTMVIENVNTGQSDPDARLQPGSMLRDRYLLQERVAGGHMGVVYKAHDRHLPDVDGKDAVVAIKVLSPHLSDNKTALRALQQEAAKGRCLNHPNIVRFIDLDREDDLYFLVMEWLEGESLADALDNGSLVADTATAIDIVSQVGEALNYAHRCGVVHADVKPGNVMYLPNGKVKLFDFGIARVRQQREGWSSAAASAMRAATPAYSSMQVLTGDEPVATDDVFSLACLAYRLIAGHRVFGPRNAAEAAEAGMEPQRPAGLSDNQWKALRKGLAFSRVSRQASPMEFVDQLTGTAADVEPEIVPNEESIERGLDQPIHIPAEAMLERRFATPRSYWLLWLLLLVAAATAVLVFRPDWRATAVAELRPLLERARTLLPAPGAGVEESGSDDSVSSDQRDAQPAVDSADSESDGPTRATVPAISAPPADTASNTETDSASAVVGQTQFEAPAAAEQIPADANARDARATNSTAVDVAAVEGVIRIILAGPGEARTEVALDLPEDGGPITLDISRSFGLSDALLLRVDEVGFSGSRSPGEAGEYVLSDDGIVSFEPGQRNASLIVHPSQDDAREADRQVTLLFRDYYNAASGYAQLQLRLQDDDQRAFEKGLAPNTVAFTNSRVVVRERDPAVLIDIVRLNPDENSLTVSYSVNDFTATEGEDYFVPGRRVITFGPRQRNARLLIPLVQDTVVEGEESFVIELSQSAPVSGAIAADSSRLVITIQDDDLPDQ